MHYDEFRAMNTDIVLAGSGPDRSRIEAGFALARSYIDQTEARFTRFTDTSELAALNRAAGEWVHVSEDMFQLLKESRRYSYDTDGLFNPAILPALIHAGYDRSMELILNSPPRTASAGEVMIDDFRRIEFDDASGSVYLPTGMQIDLGGIAKGWIVEHAAKILKDCTQACAVNAGGDMTLVNLPPGESTWEVGLEDPAAPEQDLAVLRVDPGGVATSSITKRQWYHNSRLQHHLIDPRTGMSAQTDWLSVTVWAQRLLEAEVYAKTLLIGGSQSVGASLKNSDSIAYLAVDKQGWVMGSENYHEVFHV